MNLGAHIAVASRLSPDPIVHLGSALPDLASGAHVRLAPPTGALAHGVALHHRTDAAFHAHRWFVEHNVALGRLASSAGLSRGPARAVGHVGVEFLLDAALDGPDQRALTAAAFDLSDETRAQLAALSDDPRWQRLVTRIRPGPPPSGSLGARLQQLLAPRRRLAFDPNQIELVDEVLERFRPRITGAGALVVDISNQVALPM